MFIHTYIRLYLYGTVECKGKKCVHINSYIYTYTYIHICSMVSMLSSAKEKNPPADNDMHLDSAGGKSAKEIKGWDFHDNEA